MMVTLIWRDELDKEIVRSTISEKLLKDGNRCSVPPGAKWVQVTETPAVETEMWHFAVHVPVGQAGVIREAMENALDGTEVYRAWQEGS